jgi:hypothetical protein
LHQKFIDKIQPSDLLVCRKCLFFNGGVFIQKKENACKAPLILKLKTNSAKALQERAKTVSVIAP